MQLGTTGLRIVEIAPGEDRDPAQSRGGRQVAELGNDRTLWLEANAGELNGVSFAKGCYVGQENTARMHYRAKVNRRLVVAPIAPAGDRTRAVYPDLGLMVELRRVEALGDAIVPSWLATALVAA